jgi:Signal transduction histidine kinase
MTRGVLDSLKSQFEHNQFTVSTRLDDHVSALVDPEAAVQALENLLSNAMKYSPEHREIVVEVDRADGYGVVRVRDRGIGIPPRMRRKIFEKFFRVQHDGGSGPAWDGIGACDRRSRDAGPPRLRARRQRAGAREYVYPLLPARRRREPR